ncbi:MAG: hypothetical protein PHS93_06200 [Candidatus Omnitrophica bacterium]|nr:hypothetical protein [Candidatus Omnitrophota bacterium]MDD5352739.1 hypothetical protein [Candidatus Omnitrophota bacterium]MDD5550338.1 hypothetical protein [Candidatus Omnitrophota bacterium]
MVIKLTGNDISNKLRRKDAFSFVELLISASILMVIVIGLLYTYIACFELNEFSRNLTLANNALQAKLESIRETPFDSITALDGTTFSLDGFASGQAIGVVDIYDSVYSDLKYIRLVACWKQKSNRVIGEDTNLDGTLQPQEDANGDGDGILDSPAEIITLISRVE